LGRSKVNQSGASPLLRVGLLGCHFISLYKWLF